MNDSHSELKPEILIRNCEYKFKCPRDLCKQGHWSVVCTIDFRKVASVDKHVINHFLFGDRTYVGAVDNPVYACF